MSRQRNWLYDGAVFFLREFAGQIIAAVILFAALIAWFYFSSITAAVLVLVVGILLWRLGGKFVAKRLRSTSQD